MYTFPEPHTSSFTKAFPKLIDSKVSQEKEEEIVDYKKNSDLIGNGKIFAIKYGYFIVRVCAYVCVRVCEL